MSVNEVTTSKRPPLLFEELGGVWGGGTILACLFILPGLKNTPIRPFMSIFGEKKAVRSLEEDFWQLRKQVDQLESQVKIGKLEATEVYDKTMRLMQRMAKRYAVDQKENGEQLEPEPPDDGIDPISRSIMLRRGMARRK